MNQTQEKIECGKPKNVTEGGTKNDISVKPSTSSQCRNKDNIDSNQLSFKTCFNFQTGEALPEDLQIISREPIYGIPFPMKYRHLSLKKRAEMMSNYYTKCSQVRDKIARKSSFMAPNPKPIHPSLGCKNSLTKDDSRELSNLNININENNNETINNNKDNDDSNQNIYVSRAGRQVKKKSYLEDVNDEQFNIPSPFDNELDFENDMKITVDVPLNNNNNNSLNSSNNNNNNNKNNNNDNNKSNNKELAKNKSSISTPSTKKNDGNKRLPPLENIRNNFIKKDKNYDLEFEETLARAEDESLDEYNKLHPPESLIKRDFIQLVSPPSKKRNATRKRSVYQIDDDDDFKRDPPLGKTPNRSRNAEVSPKRKRVGENNTSPRRQITCPICNKGFAKNEVEEHAATCSDFPKETIEAVSGNKVINLTCELCDSTFLTEVEYINHARICI